MKNKTKASSIFALPLFVCFSAGSIASPNPQPDIADLPGNLVKNGNFEQLNDNVGIRHGAMLSDVNWRGWEFYTAIPEWFLSLGYTIEVQRGHEGIDPPANGGGQVLDMDSTLTDGNGNLIGEAGNYWVSQNVTNLTPGANYTLNFQYNRGNSNASSQSRGVAVYWGERLPGKNACNVSSVATGGWHEIECNVTATATEMYLTFAGFGDESTGRWGDKFGGLIDVVTLVATP